MSYLLTRTIFIFSNIEKKQNREIMPVKTVTSPSSAPQVMFHLTDRRSKMITANNNNNFEDL